MAGNPICCAAWELPPPTFDVPPRSSSVPPPQPASSRAVRARAPAGLRRKVEIDGMAAPTLSSAPVFGAGPGGLRGEIDATTNARPIVYIAATPNPPAAELAERGTQLLGRIPR